MIDLHVHTTNSDGRLKVEEILERKGICMEEGTVPMTEEYLLKNVYEVL